MEGDGFLTGILLNGHYGDVAGIDDLTFPITQDNESTHDLPSQVQQVDVEVQPTRSTKGSKRTKNFHRKEDEVVCSGWLNVSKDPITGANQSRSTLAKITLTLSKTRQLQLWGQRVPLCIGGWQFRLKWTSFVHAMRRLSVGIKVEQLSKTRYAICV